MKATVAIGICLVMAVIAAVLGHDPSAWSAALMVIWALER